MNNESKIVLLKNKDKLSELINFEKLRPYLEKHKIFTKTMLNDLYADSSMDFFLELTTRGPNAFEDFKKVLFESKYFEALKLISGSPVIKSSKIPTCYKMNSNPLGYCLIINNVDFRNLEKRYGSDVDAKELRKLFKKIGYEVEDDERNLTAAEMRSCIENFIASKDWSSVDSCILVILSHGSNLNNLDIIYGIDSDSDYLKKIEIYKMVNSKDLIHKPKILIFQSCRGGTKDHGRCVRESSDASKFDLKEPEEGTGIKYPSMADMIALHASLPYHEAIRDWDKGAWFIQDLVTVFSEDYLTHDLVEMTNRVNRLMSQRVSLKGTKENINTDILAFNATLYFNLLSLNEQYEIYKPNYSILPIR